jgi:hypothetical protein
MDINSLIPVLPKEDDPFLKQLVDKMRLVAKPVLVPIRPSAESTVNECFPNVERQIASFGGTQILGWQIWKTKNLIEAEFHAIWKTVNDELIDITPKIVSMNEILFVEDQEYLYEGMQVDNIRLNITGNLLVDDLILVSETIFEIENRGSRAYEYELSLGGDELRIWETLNLMKMQLPIMLGKGLTRNQRCFCGANKYKKCHGKFLRLLHGL